MAKRGRKFKLHGAFGTKTKAEQKHKQVKRSWIIKRRICGDTRYVVLSEK